MYYSVEFELCALIFLIIITIRFFDVRRFPSRENRLFGFVLFCAIADLMLDIGGSVTMEYAAVVPVWVNYAINTVFYSIQLTFPALLMNYVIVMADDQVFRRPVLLLLHLPVALFELMLIINLFNGSIFSVPLVDGAHSYVHGPLFPFLYFGAFFYMLVTDVLALRFRRKLQKKQFSTILYVTLIIVLAAVIQYFLPWLLLTGVAITISILLMFFTLQNPEDMLDLITGLFNYNAMITFLDNHLRENRPLWLMAVDVGGIRRVNSNFGVRTGNVLLGQIGAFFIGCRETPWAFRMIGTRFLLVASEEDVSKRHMSMIEKRFQAPWHVNGLDIMLSTTIRYFNDLDSCRTPEDVVNLIDQVYSEIGAEGWGGSKCVDSEILRKMQRRLVVEGAIRRALEDDEGFQLYYQPIFSTKEQRFLSAEVLLRLNAPGIGTIPPGEFIPIAEQSGLILSIDSYVLRNTCAFIERNLGQNLAGLEYLEVNLSAAEFFQNTCGHIETLVRDIGVPPEMLCFEVTETASTTHQAVLSEFMHRMIGLGYRFALDDFGTGFANVTQVTNLPFSLVKLDRTMLAANEEKTRILFDGLLEVFGRMGLDTLVEGAETVEQTQRLHTLGANYIQGFYYAQPMPEDAFLAFLKDHGGAD